LKNKTKSKFIFDYFETIRQWLRYRSDNSAIYSWNVNYRKFWCINL